MQRWVLAGFNIIKYIVMWKSIGNIKNDDAASVRSNRSRNEITLEPFHHKIKHTTKEIPATNRSFCRQYFQKKRTKTFNHSLGLNKSQGNISLAKNNNTSTELHKQGSKDKDEQGSKLVERTKQVPDEQRNRKNYDQLKKASNKIHNLKKDQAKLKSTVQNEFQSIKNIFYQLQQQVHEAENQTLQPTTATQSLDLDFFKEILGEAVGIQLYFQQMERKKAALMQKLNQ